MTFTLTAPGTDEPLVAVDDGYRSATGVHYPVSDGIADLLDPAERARFDEFARDYGRFRASEGRSPVSREAIEALPFVDVSGRLVDVWAQRAASYEAFAEGIAGLATGSMIDVGAGCGWLALRLARQGWSAAAIDVTIDGDGLGAAAAFADEMFVARADMERLPFASSSVDLVVFNASLHYAESIERSFDEAHRVVRPTGTLVVMDSPVYRDPAAGRAMVAEFTNGAAAGDRPAVDLAGPGFVTEADLSSHQDRHAVRSCTRLGEPTGIKAMAHSVIGRRRAGREVARRPVLLFHCGGQP